MKKLLIMMLLLCSILIFNSCTMPQVLVSIPNQVSFLEMPGTKNDLYIKANQWMIKSFKDAKSVIQFQDKESGKIMGKYLLKEQDNTPGITNGSLYCLITISIKDNATKIEIIPPEKWLYSAPNPNSPFFSIYSYSPEMAKKDIEKLIIDYVTFMFSKETVW